jgi:hypothetical protein
VRFSFFDFLTARFSFRDFPGFLALAFCGDLSGTLAPFCHWLCHRIIRSQHSPPQAVEDLALSGLVLGGKVAVLIYTLGQGVKAG